MHWICPKYCFENTHVLCINRHLFLCTRHRLWMVFFTPRVLGSILKRDCRCPSESVPAGGSGFFSSWAILLLTGKQQLSIYSPEHVMSASWRCCASTYWLLTDTCRSCKVLQNWNSLITVLVNLGYIKKSSSLYCFHYKISEPVPCIKLKCLQTVSVKVTGSTFSSNNTDGSAKERCSYWQTANLRLS